VVPSRTYLKKLRIKLRRLKARLSKFVCIYSRIQCIFLRCVDLRWLILFETLMLWVSLFLTRWRIEPILLRFCVSKMFPRRLRSISRSMCTGQHFLLPLINRTVQIQFKRWLLALRTIEATRSAQPTTRVLLKWVVIRFFDFNCMGIRWVSLRGDSFVNTDRNSLQIAYKIVVNLSGINRALINYVKVSTT